jgi:cbb3-type cytochrome oxidase subunit 1
LAATQKADIRTLLGAGADEDRLAVSHFLIGAGFLVGGGLLQALAIFTLRFDDLLPIGYGLLESMANLTLVLGFAVISLLGGVYYVLPRLTGTRLWGADLARLALLGLTGLVLAGDLVLAVGLGSGRQPFGLDWWASVPIALVLFLPAAVTIGTLRNRRETRSFVTLWFVIGGVIWLPMLFLAHLVGELPVVGAVTASVSDLFLSAGVLTMVIITLGTGLVYYTVVKELDVPLASRQLGIVGFWSLGFAGVWWGLAQTVFGPGPDWIAGVAAALGLAFPIGALINAANVSMTLEGHWDEMGDRPGVASGVYGLYFAVAIAVMASFASFPTIGSVTALTTYWEAIEYAILLGAGSLLVAGITFEALPRAAGRRLPTSDRARTFNRLTIVGVGGVLVSLAAAGLVTGYSWLGGSNTAAFQDAGDTWAVGAGAAEVLTLVAVGFAIVTVLGQFAYASVVAGTIFSGKVVAQDLLVADGDDDE